MSLPPPEMNVDLYAIMSSRDEVERGTTEGALRSLCELLTPDNCARFRQRVLFGINGYDDDPRDLWEVPETRRWIQQIDAQWPYWFYFLWPGERSTLPVVAFSLCPFTVIPEGGKRIEPDVLQTFMTEKIKRMNELCAQVGDSESIKVEMTKRVCAFFGGAE